MSRPKGSKNKSATPRGARSRVWQGKSGGFCATKKRRGIDGLHLTGSLARDIEEGSKPFWASRRGGVV
jgi:hypothetical protein